MMIQDCELQAVIDEELLGPNDGRNLWPLWPPRTRPGRAVAKAGVEGGRDRQDQRQIQDMSDLLLMVE